MNKAKEKAAELVELFSPYCYCFLGSGMLTNTQNDEVQLRNAKECALIHIDQILKLDCLTDEAWLNVPDEYKVQYWKEVRMEVDEYNG